MFTVIVPFMQIYLKNEFSSLKDWLGENKTSTSALSGVEITFIYCHDLIMHAIGLNW